MSGQSRPSYYDKRKLFVDNVVATSNFNSDVQDARIHQVGLIKAEWSGYDGTNGILRLQISDEKVATDSKWSNWGGELGEGLMDSAADTCIWEVTFPPCFFRLRMEIGDGTTVNLTVSHILGD